MYIARINAFVMSKKSLLRNLVIILNLPAKRSHECHQFRVGQPVASYNIDTLLFYRLS